MIGSSTAVLVVGALAAACGGSGGSLTSAVTATGAVEGVPLTLHYAVSAVDLKHEYLLIEMFQIASCADVAIGPVKTDQMVALTLYSTDAAGMQHAPTMPGTFFLDGSTANHAESAIERYDDACMAAPGEFVDGTVTLATVSSSGASGSFALTQSVGGLPTDSLTGTFSSVECAAIEDVPLPNTCH